MDMWLIGTDGGAHIRPISIHGMLWLQTHFEASNWEALASNTVKLSTADADALSLDAKQAGLQIMQVPSLSLKGRL